MEKSKKIDIEKKLLEIGNDVASLWGASCYDFKINKAAQKVEFICIEAGEDFETDMSYEDIKEEYGFDISLYE